MKNVFTYREGTPDGNAFAIRQLSGELAEKKRAFDEENKRFNRHFNRVESLPEILEIVAVFVACLCVVGICIIENRSSEKRNAVFFVLIAIAAIAALLAIALEIFTRIERVPTKAEQSYYSFQDERQKFLGELLTELGFDVTRLERFRMDVLGCRYTTQKGKIKRYPASLKKHLAIDTMLWRENEAFYFFDGYAVYEFPLKDLIKTEKIERRICFYGWNKNVPCGVKPYAVRRKAFINSYSIKNYYRLAFGRNCEEYEILFPNYEKQTLEKLTGKTLS